MRFEIGIALLAICGGAGCLQPDDEASTSTGAFTAVDAIDSVAATGAPLPGISPTAFNAAMQAFNDDETITDGLGPLFNATGCGRCHTLGGIGGAGTQINRHFGRFVDGKFDPLASEGGDTRSLSSLGTFRNGATTCSVPVEKEPADATIHNVGRLTPALFGLGLIDAMPDSFFDALAAAQTPEIRGTVKRQGILMPNPADHSQAIGTLRVARFGWKDALTNLAEFSAAAYNGEMGISTQSCINGAPFLIFAGEAAPNGIPVAPGCDDLAPPPPPGVPAGVDEAVGSCDGGKTEFAGDIQQFLDFMTFIGPPTRDLGDAVAIARGAPIFARIGCVGCHVATTFVTPNPSPNGVPGGFRFQPFSDFLVHDMGSLGDLIGNPGDSVATTRQMRTAPLWGIRFRTFLLHDGRAGNIDAAIRAHDGQAASAAAAYRRLRASDQRNLVQFVRSL